MQALACKWREAKQLFQLTYFEQLLRNNNHNISRSAEQAGMARKNLAQKLKPFDETTESPR